MTQITLRDYQQDAVNSARKTLAEGTRKALVIAPTGSGKSVMIAAIIEQAYRKKTPRILILCHQANILEQNEKAIKKLVPYAKTGIYCAGLGRKETKQDIILASRDSLGNNIKVCGNFNVIICDESHMIASEIGKKKTRYGKIFEAYKNCFVIGFTATPYRVDNGLIFGKDKFFQKVAYNIPMNLLIERGYLSNYIFPSIRPQIDTSSIKKTAGDFNLKQLDEVSSTDSVVKSCLKLWWQEAKNRHCTIFFCCSRAHAKVVQKHIYEYLSFSQVAYVDGDTAIDERNTIFRLIDQGRIKAVVSIAALTTGVDIPKLDCACILRATHSASLFVQMVGRILRTAPEKKDALILDMAGNMERFASIEQPFVKDKSLLKKKETLEKGEAPIKKCPQCLMENATAASICGFCEHVFYNHTKTAHIDFKEYTITKAIVESSQTKNLDDCFIYTFFVQERQKPFKKWCMPYSKNRWASKEAHTWIRSFKNGHKPTKLIVKDPSASFPKITVAKWEETDECLHLNFSFRSADGKMIRTCNHCGHEQKTNKAFTINHGVLRR